jgi:hypothetical protein
MNDSRQVQSPKVAHTPMSTGPRAAPAAAADPTTAYPLILSLPGGKNTATMPKMAGIMRAEPIPSRSDQPAIIISKLSEKAVMTAPIPYSPTPRASVRLRPQMSPSLLPVSMQAAITSE